MICVASAGIELYMEIEKQEAWPDRRSGRRPGRVDCLDTRFERREDEDVKFVESGVELVPGHQTRTAKRKTSEYARRVRDRFQVELTSHRRQ
jgi:hypothetical protein